MDQNNKLRSTNHYIKKGGFKCPCEKAADPRESNPSLSPSLWDESTPEMSLSTAVVRFVFVIRQEHANMGLVCTGECACE